MKKEYFFTHVGRPGNPSLLFVGNIDIEEKPFESLNVGDKINRVGTGDGIGPGKGMASLNRSMDFKSYVTYVGMAKIEEISNEHELIFFQIRDRERLDIFMEPMYTAFIVLDHKEVGKKELKLWDHEANALWIARPVFKKYE